MINISSDRRDELLQSVFGFSSFRAGQEEIVNCLSGGEHCLAIMPTGAGKSLCYQLSALLRGGLTVVVSPLVSLMQDQVAALKESDVAADTINSGRSREDNVAVWRRVAQGELKLLYLSPERLMTGRMISALQNIGLDMVIVDEAHCISQWGHDFRPEYGELSRLRDLFPGIVIGAFTATADEVTRKEISEKLFAGQGRTMVHGFDRPNIFLDVREKKNPKQQILSLLKDHEGQQGIIYCLSRKNVSETADFLQKEGHKALAYHAGMPADVRRDHQERFLAEPDILIVATIAFGMGIDKPDVRFVFHMNLPGSMESYYQEIGRAGRDGAPARAVMLYGFGDIQSRRSMIESGGGNEAKRTVDHQRLNLLLSYCEAPTCRRQVLLRYFDDDCVACGHCDSCVTPPEQYDGTERANMVLNAIIQSREIFGQAQIIDILVGSDTAKIRENDHQSLQVYGTGKELKAAEWRSILRQLFAANLITVDIAGYGSLKITQAGRELLAGKRTASLKKITYVEKTPSKRQKSSRKQVELAEGDEALYIHLKTLRQNIAREKNVPAYVVFHDRTLREMATKRPGTLTDMMDINGVGQAKLDHYGEDFLSALGEF